jgi:flagellar motility protein MotE (MotC chaperone)
VANADVEKGSYSGFERFLFFVTPILFTAVLLAVLLLLFNSDWRNSAVQIGNKIPVIKSLVPDPTAQGDLAQSDETLTVNNAKAKIEELKALLTDRETALQQATEQTTQQKKQLEDMKTQIDDLSKANEERTVTEKAYEAKIASLAGMYAKMTPSKAAPILESLSVEESALVLGAMTEVERGRVLERMTPAKAADVTMKLKDADTVDNREIAALQARIKQLEQQAGLDAMALDTTELNKTFSSMPPAKAATLLLQMTNANEAKVLKILGVLGDASRSAILAAMSDENKKTTAALVSKLMPTNP